MFSLLQTLKCHICKLQCHRSLGPTPMMAMLQNYFQLRNYFMDILNWTTWPKSSHRYPFFKYVCVQFTLLKSHFVCITAGVLILIFHVICNISYFGFSKNYTLGEENDHCLLSCKILVKYSFLYKWDHTNTIHLVRVVALVAVPT